MRRRDWVDKAFLRLRGDDADHAPERAPGVVIDAPRLSAELLLCAVLAAESSGEALGGRPPDRLEYIRRPDEPLSEQALLTLNALLARCLQGEPLAYLLGVREFYGRSFAVSSATLVPRPETECLVDEALGRMPEGGEPVRFVDLGCGSGCIGITLAAERPFWEGVAVDISEDALAVALANAERLGVAERLRCMQGDFTMHWTSLPAVDLVVSNPPYISEDEYATLEAGVRVYEPRNALVPGPTGLEHPAAVVLAAAELLRSGGLLLMEHGAGQGAACRALCTPEAWDQVSTGQDWAGRDRYLVAYRR